VENIEDKKKRKTVAPLSLSIFFSLFYHVVCMCVRVPLFFPPLYSVLYLKETLIWAGTPQFTSDISKKEKREKERKNLAFTCI